MSSTGLTFYKYAPDFYVAASMIKDVRELLGAVEDLAKYVFNNIVPDPMKYLIYEGEWK